MTNLILFKTIFADVEKKPEQQLTLFALLNLGILDSLASGTISADDALQTFFHADNCFFVRRTLRNQSADAIMSHGVQLPDLFEVLPPKEAQREFQREIALMRSLCKTLLEEKRLAA